MSNCDIRSDNLQKPCSQVKGNSLQHKFNEHLFCAHPAMLSRSWHHWYFKWPFLNSSIRLKNRVLLCTIPAHPSLARSLIISVIHPLDCNLSINPSLCDALESLECSCLTLVSLLKVVATLNLYPPLWDCPVSPPPTTRLSVLLTLSLHSLALCRPTIPRRTPGAPLAFSPPCPGLHLGVCPHPGLKRAFVPKYKKEPKLKSISN